MSEDPSQTQRLNGGSSDEAPQEVQASPASSAINMTPEKKEKMKGVIAKFFQQYGYHGALKAFEEECKGGTSSSSNTSDITELAATYEKDQLTGSSSRYSLHHIRSNKQVGNSEVLSNYLNDSKPSGKGYLQAYQSLTDWVFSSLEIYKVCCLISITEPCCRMN